jgi:hypothetical protein
MPEQLDKQQIASLSEKGAYQAVEELYEQIGELIASFGGDAMPEFLPELFDENPELGEWIIIRQQLRNILISEQGRRLMEPGR